MLHGLTIHVNAGHPTVLTGSVLTFTMNAGVFDLYVLKQNHMETYNGKNYYYWAIRGGSWTRNPHNCGVINRNGFGKNHRDYSSGFRLVCIKNNTDGNT